MADRHTTTAYPLRLTEQLKSRVEAAAKENGRSFNSEVAIRLQSSFEPTSTKSGFIRAELDDLLSAVSMRVTRQQFRAKALGDAYLAVRQGLAELHPDEFPESEATRKLEQLAHEAIADANQAGAMIFNLVESMLLDQHEPVSLDFLRVASLAEGLDPHGRKVKHAEQPARLATEPDNLQLGLSSATSAVNPGGLQGRSNPTRRGLADEASLGLQIGEPRRSLADARIRTKPGGGLGLSDTNAATGVGSKPLPQRIGLADAAPAKATYAEGAEKLLKSTAGKRAKPSK